jgi:bifunctional non-homologous end joining protein LigD
MRFVIHEHSASHHHFDLRLEEDGVLRSWAIPKNVPLWTGEKRLAIEVEDHPLSYIDFQGTIPEGQYGAGKVSIWDKGTYTLDKEEPKSLEVTLHGKRVRGSYRLVRFKGDNQWLLYKV